MIKILERKVKKLKKWNSDTIPSGFMIALIFQSGSFDYIQKN